MTGKMHTIGSRRQVWNGNAKKTSGGLLKSDLMMNKHGRIVSRAKHATAKKDNRLVKAGYGTKKGKFGFVKMGSKSKKMRKGSKKMRGGHYGVNSSMSPAMYDVAGEGITVSSGDNLQMLAGMAGGRRKKSSMYGGSGMMGLSPASLSAEGMMMSADGGSGNGIAGQGITVGAGGSTNVQMLAGMAGGRRRKMRKMRKMRGGLTNPSMMGYGLSNNGVTNQALNAGF
jgi:hypothetical protein